MSEGNFLIDIMSLSNGRVILERPSTISEDEVADIEEWIGIVLRTMKRVAAKNATLQPKEQP